MPETNASDSAAAIACMAVISLFLLCCSMLACLFWYGTSVELDKFKQEAVVRGFAEYRSKKLDRAVHPDTMYIDDIQWSWKTPKSMQIPGCSYDKD